MQEAEVSLRIAFYHIVNGLTDKDVNVSIDGAHIKTGNTVHFDIDGFMADNDCQKIDGNMKRWQGEYRINGYDQKIIISSVPGIGDVNIECKDGKQLYIESKKGKNDKNGQEYPLMREAIGQLMTGCTMTKNVIAIVAVPYSEKSYNLASKWTKFEQMQLVGIKFYLVKEDGDIVIV
jgi:hypothetical protein